MYKKPFNFVLFSLAVVSLLVFYAAPAAAEITNVMDSNAFSYKYEGDALPDTIDLDGNGHPDWTISIDGGTSAIVTVGTRTALEIVTATGDDTLAYRASTLVGTTTCWPVANIQFDDGWTVECSVKVVSMVAGRDGAGLFRASPADNDAHGGIWIASTGQVWEGPRDALGSPEQQEDNTDDFHVFRLAQEPGAATYSAWRDGVLLERFAFQELRLSAQFPAVWRFGLESRWNDAMGLRPLYVGSIRAGSRTVYVGPAGDGAACTRMLLPASAEKCLLNAVSSRILEQRKRQFIDIFD